MKLKTLLLSAILSALPAYAGTITGNLQTPSGLPVKGGTLTFTLQQAGLISGTGAVAGLSSSCYTSIGGQVVGLPDPSALPIVATQTSGAGNLPGGIYYVETTHYNTSGESVVSPELQIQLSSTGSLIVSLPTSGLPSGATGVRVYMSTTRGAETLQGSFGTAFPGTYSQNVPLAAGVSPPGANTSICTIAFNDTIVPYQGYNVTLTSSSGNAYPGWPQAWQLNGGVSGTVNVSNGAPLWNGTVIYPMPIVAQPLNHGPQSISGNLDFGGYNVTNAGTFTAGTVNSVVNAALNATVGDIGAKINASLAACGSQCTIYIPAGSYTFSTQIQLPLNVYGTYKLSGDVGAVLNYAGNSDAIFTPIGVNGPGESQLIIEGFQLNGNASATSGIHTYPTNRITIRNLNIQGFSGGDGLRIEGTNSMNVYDNLITNNLNGVHLIPTLCSSTYPYTCSGTLVGGSGYTPNAVHIHDNQITDNTHWGVWDDRNGVTAGLTGSLGNVIAWNDLEQNGGAGPTYGALYLMHGRGSTVEGNYFESSPREVVLGELSAGAPLNTAGTSVVGNYFTTSPPTGAATSAYDIELQNVIDTLIQGNAELVTGGVGGNNCFMNAATSGETRTLIGRNAIFQSSPSGNPICVNGTAAQSLAGAGSATLISQQYQAYVAYQNYAVLTGGTSETVAIQNLTASGSCSLYPQSAAARTSFFAGTSYLSSPGAGGITINHPSGTAMTFDIWCANNPVGGYGYP